MGTCVVTHTHSTQVDAQRCLNTATFLRSYTRRRLLLVIVSRLYNAYLPRGAPAHSSSWTTSPLSRLYTPLPPNSIYICSGHTVLAISRLHPVTYNHSWRVLKRAIRSPRLCKSIPSGTFSTLRCRLVADHRSPTGRSFQDALRAFFQPIGTTDDARADFYTMYKKEATEYDADYVRKYDGDLNTTLIFVSRSSSALANI